MAISLPIVSKFDDKGIKQAELSIGAFEGVAVGIFAKIGAVAVDAFAQASRAAFDFGVESVKAASSFNEVTSAVGQVFGEGSKQLEDFAATAAKSFGQSRTQALDAAKTFGIFGKAAGLSSQENVDFSKTLTTLASDLASFNNTSVDEAITSLGAALRGESEPIRRFGVLLDDAALKARALQMGIYDGTGSLTQQQRVLAAYQEILAQTTVQQGDYIRTADGVANSSRSLEATFKDLQITVGQALLPAIEAVLPQLASFIDEMVASPEFNEFLSEMGDNFGYLLSFLPTALGNLQSFGRDALPAINAFFPVLNEALGLFASIFNDVANTDASGSTSSFASSMRDLANSLRAVGEAIKIINDFWNSMPPFLKMNFFEVLGTLASGAQWGGGQAAANKLFINPPKIPSGIGGRISSIRPKLAEGGIVMPRPGGVPVTVAEAGQAEAVIPLDRLSSFSGRGGNITINVTAGMGTDGAALGEQIVNAIRRYERTSGAVFARA